MLLRSPGSWLYRRANLAWLSDASLVCQLPLLYRLFARYCQASWFHPAIAELGLHGIIALEHLRNPSRNGIVPLRIGDLTVMLDLYDPRFLRVPGEVTEVPHILRRFLKPGDTFIDVGANHGSFSIVASRLVGPLGLVISIEPQPRLAALLGMLLANGPARFQVHPVACGDRAAEAELFIPGTTSGSAGLFKAFSGRSRHCAVPVVIRPLDDLIDWRRLSGETFVKVDIEGGELAFLSGARDLIRAAAPPIMMEVNPRAMRAAATSAADLIEALAGLGYNQLMKPDGSCPPQALSIANLLRDVIVLPRE